MRRIRPEKKAILAEVKDVIEKSNCLLLVGYRGLTVENLTDLRRRMKKTGSRVTVIRNIFLQKIATEMGLEGVGEMLEGPVLMITGAGDAVLMCKALHEFAGEVKLTMIKGGNMKGGKITPQDIVSMAKLPSRELLIGKAVMTIAAPLSSLVGVMKQKVSSLLYVLKSLEEKKTGK